MRGEFLVTGVAFFAENIMLNDVTFLGQSSYSQVLKCDSLLELRSRNSAAPIMMVPTRWSQSTEYGNAVLGAQDMPAAQRSICNG